MENPFEGLEHGGGHDKAKHAVFIGLAVVVIIAVIIVAVRSVGSSGSGSAGSAGSLAGLGGSQGTSDATGTTGSPSLADQLGYQQGLAVISNGQATLAESLQASLAGTETTLQEELTTFNNAAYSSKLSDTLKQLEAGQTIVNQQLDTQIAAQSNLAITDASNSLTAFFEHSNGNGLSGSGKNDKNLSLSDAVGNFLSKNGSGGASFLTSFLTATTPQNVQSVSTPNAAQGYLTAVSQGLGV